MPRPRTAAHSSGAAHGQAAAWLLAALVVLAGCAGAPERPATVRKEEPDAAARALAAAESATNAQERAEALLSALRELLERGDFDAAARVQRQLAATALTDAQRFESDAAALELALAAGDASTTARLAETLQPATWEQRLEAARLAAQALASADDPMAAVLSLMAAVEQLDASGDLDAATDDVATITEAVWRGLSRLPAPVLASLAASAPTPVAAAWLALAHQFNSALAASSQAQTWRAWRALNPGHPAARFPPPSIVRTPTPVRALALLVPLSGDLAALAEAVRDGFLAAHLHAARSDGSDVGSVPTVAIYDTGIMSVAEAHDRALADGADILVGPLDKAAVSELAALPPQLPVLALNQPDDGSAPFPQLTLAVEETAAAIAARLPADGVERVALFESGLPGGWASRARTRFEADLDGIEVVAVGTLAGTGDATQVAGDVLGIAAGQERHASLTRLLGARLEFMPRRRDDVDALVAFVDDVQLTALRPALDFHFAGDLATYAPAQSVRGAAWAEFEGLRVCDIPWRIYKSELREASADLATSRGSLAAVFALGVDGYRLANQLHRLTIHGESVAGSTGQLTLQANGLIRRGMAWGEVVGGRLVALDDAAR